MEQFIVTFAGFLIEVARLASMKQSLLVTNPVMPCTNK